MTGEVPVYETLEAEPRKSRGGPYPPDWKAIAERIKAEAGWKCARCGHAHQPRAGYTLTVHHADMDPANCAWWNLLPLCQKCHLTIQGKVILERPWMLDHSPWFRPYVAGYYARQHGFPEDRAWVTGFADWLIALGQGRLTYTEVVTLTTDSANSAEVNV